MRLSRILGAALLAALVMGAAPAAAQDPPTPKQPPEGRHTVQTEDLVPIQQEAATRSAAAVPCYETIHGDPNEFDDNRLDADKYWFRYDCSQRRWGLAVRTIDNWPIEELFILDIVLDTDGNLNNGCLGTDFAVDLGYDPASGEVRGGLFRVTSCEPGTDVLVSSSIRWSKPSGNTIEMSFPAGPLAGHPTLRWQGALFAWNQADVVPDFFPDFDSNATPNLACGRCAYLRNSLSNGPADITFASGATTDEVLVGDWDGNGTQTLGFRRGRTFYLTNSHGGPAVHTFSSGLATDRVLVGDWDGNGTDTIGLRRGTTFYLRNTLGSGTAHVTFSSGLATDQVKGGDWNGDGRDTFALRRGTTMYFKNTNRSGPADATFSSGLATDTWLIGDWDADGDDTYGLRRGRTFYLRNFLSTGTANITFNSGLSSDVALIGDWDGNGRDGFGLRR